MRFALILLRGRINIPFHAVKHLIRLFYSFFEVTPFDGRT